MYIMSHDTYTCDFCDIELAWDEEDDVRGKMWGCEVCGKDFCEKCFVDKFGRKTWEDMLQGALSGPFEGDILYCPDCFSRIKKGGSL